MNEDPLSVVTEINGCISTAAKRQHGLLKLALFLETCQSKEQCSLMEKNSPFWFKTILQLLENHPISIHAKLAHYCFYLLIQNAKNASPELSRMISTNFIEKSVLILISSNEQLAKNSLACLNEMINCFRGSCSQYRQKIETYVLNKMDSNSEDVIESAAKCYSKLAFLHKNQSNNDMWYAYFKNLLKNANLILNELFDDYQANLSLDETLKDVSMNSSLNDTNKTTQSTSASLCLNKAENLFHKLSKENLDYYFNKSVKRFKACLLALGYMFEPLNEQVIIKIRLNEIIQFLKRIYFFDLKKLIADVRVNVEARYLCETLSDLFNSALKFTSQLISVANSNLIPNSNEINQMLTHLGSSLNEKILFNSVSVYFECLTEWMATLGGNSGLSSYCSSLIDVLLRNITPHKTNVLAIDTNKNSQGKSKQNQQLDKDLFFNDKLYLNNFQLEIRTKIIISALNCLNEFIKRFNEKLNYNTFEKIQQTIINIVLSIQNNFTSQKPYDQSKCRIELYKNLYELCLTRSSKIAPPLSISITLFRNALNDSSNEIKLFAQTSLNNLRSFAYPILPIYIKEYHIDMTYLQQPPGPLQTSEQTHQMSQEASQYDPILNLTSNKLSTQLEDKLSFLSNNAKSLFNSQANNNLNSENTASSSSNGMSDHIYANSNSLISNNTNSNRANNSKNQNSSLNEMKNSLNLVTNQNNQNASSNNTNGNNTLKRKNLSRDNSLNEDSYQNGSKMFFAEKKNKTMSNEDSNGNEKEVEDDLDDEEEDLGEEDTEDEEDLVDEEDDEDDEDDDDMNEESEDQISGVKKIETSDEVIRIDSEEDAEEDFDDEDEDDDEFDDESEESQDKKQSKPNSNSNMNNNNNNNTNHESNLSNDNNKKTESNSNSNDNDLEPKKAVSKLLNSSDYEDDDVEEEDTNSKHSAKDLTLNKNDDPNTEITIENKENCITKVGDDLVLAKTKSPKPSETCKELNNQSLNILKSPITRGESNESDKINNFSESSNKTVDSATDLKTDEQLNESLNKNNENEFFKKKFFAEQLEVHVEQEGQQLENINAETKQQELLASEEVLNKSDLKLKEMCATFNPDALAESMPQNNTSEQTNE